MQTQSQPSSYLFNNTKSADNYVICQMQIQRIKDQCISYLKRKNYQTNRNPYYPQIRHVSIDYITKTFKSASRYSVKPINSVILKDGKIYNLLEQDVDKRTITCGCVKSHCQAKYCECFRWGETCSDKCSCVGCKNKSVRKLGEVKSQGSGCNCVKSGCKKKYCQCFQRGKKCDQSCNCKGCFNKD